MKYLYITLSLLITCSISFGQNTENVKTAFSSGNASGLSAELANEIELCIGNDVQFFNKSETLSTLNKWFSKVNPSKFSGRIEGGSSVKYYKGQLATAEGVYKVMIYYNPNGDTYKIDEIRIGKGK